MPLLWILGGALGLGGLGWTIHEARGAAEDIGGAKGTLVGLAVAVFIGYAMGRRR